MQGPKGSRTVSRNSNTVESGDQQLSLSEVKVCLSLPAQLRCSILTDKAAWKASPARRFSWHCLLLCKRNQRLSAPDAQRTLQLLLFRPVKPGPFNSINSINQDAHLCCWCPRCRRAARTHSTGCATHNALRAALVGWRRARRGDRRDAHAGGCTAAQLRCQGL